MELVVKTMHKHGTARTVFISDLTLNNEHQWTWNKCAVVYRLPVLKQHGGGSRRFISLRKSPNASAFARSFAPAVVVLHVLFASTASVSHRVSIMVDILMLMFFAIVGLVFLSYIIYLLWWSCVATRAAGAQGQHGMCVLRALHPSVLSWTMVWQRFFDILEI